MRYIHEIQDVDGVQTPLNGNCGGTAISRLIVIMSDLHFFSPLDEDSSQIDPNRRWVVRKKFPITLFGFPNVDGSLRSLLASK